MIRSLSFEPLISPALWAALALLAVGMWVWYARSRPAGISVGRWRLALALMAAGLAMPLAILLNPTWVERIPPPPGKPALTIMVDRSASMATPDVAGAESRYEAARRLTEGLVHDLATDFDVDIQTFAEQPMPADLKALVSTKANGASTDLASAITSGLDEYRPQGQAIILFSDGIHHGTDRSDGSVKVLEAARLAKAMSAPIYTRTFGGDIRQWDLAVDLRSAQVLAHVGQHVPLNFRLRQRGVTSGNARILLLHDGKEVERREVVLSPQTENELAIHIRREEAGLYRFELRVEPLHGEQNLANNSATYLLHVVDAPIRILLLEGKPYWDAKFLARTLTSDRAVALDSVVRLAAGRFARHTLSRKDEANEGSSRSPGAGDKAVHEPIDSVARTESWKIVKEGGEILSEPEQLNAYQIIVLGRDAEHFLTDQAMANLRAWLTEQGGSLVCYRGPPTAQTNERLDRLMPVRWSNSAESRFRMQLTDEGRELQWLSTPQLRAGDNLLSALPPLATAAQVDGVKPLTVVLATATAAKSDEERPVLSYQPYGSGRVVVIEGAGMWRWGFLPPEYQEQQVVYAAFWQSMLRWLVSDATVPAGEQIVLRTDKVNFVNTEPATATLFVRGENRPAPPVELIANGKPAGSFTPVPLGSDSGMYRVAFGKLPEGRYEAVIAGTAEKEITRRTMFDVQAVSDEQVDLQARADLMGRIARDSNGEVLGQGLAEEVRSKFVAYRQRTHPDRVRRIPAWDRWWVLVGVIGVWAAAWSLRRSSGLV